VSDAKSFTVSVSALAPVALTPVALTNGQFEIQVSGPVGPDYVLQASTTLTDWSSVWTNTPALMPFSFTDTNTPSAGHRFYRAMLAP